MIFIVMFAIIVALPIVSAILCIAYVISYSRSVKTNNLSPGSVEEEKLNKYKSLSRIFGIVAFVTLALACGVTVLLFYAVEHM